MIAYTGNCFYDACCDQINLLKLEDHPQGHMDLRYKILLQNFVPIKLQGDSFQPESETGVLQTLI